MMRRFVSTLFALATVAAGPLAAQSHPSFSGTWVLDTAKSQGMVPKSSELKITQTDKSLTIERNAVGPTGQQVSSTLVYNLDGTPSTNTLGGSGMTVDLKSTTTWEGPALVINTTADFQGGMKQTERLTLDDAGKQLTVHGDIAVAGQTASGKLVFTKK
jgi:hypothetical protein